MVNGSYDGFAAFSQVMFLFLFISSVIVPVILVVFGIWAVFRVLGQQNKKNELLGELAKELKDKKLD